MKLVKEILYEKFEEESDPLVDMSIGSVHRFKNFVQLFSDKDINHYIYTIAILNNGRGMDIWFYAPIIRKLDIEKRNTLFNYMFKIIEELGFSSLLLNPDPHMQYENEDKRKGSMPGVIRYELHPSIRYKLKAGEYRRWRDAGQNIEYLQGIPETYEKDLKNSRVS